MTQDNIQMEKILKWEQISDNISLFPDYSALEMFKLATLDHDTEVRLLAWPLPLLQMNLLDTGQGCT